MDFSNLTVSFTECQKHPETIYHFGRSKVRIISYGTYYYFSYENDECMKIETWSEDLPHLFQIYIERLYNAFDIKAYDIESCIKSIQAWKRRNTETKKIYKND